MAFEGILEGGAEKLSEMTEKLDHLPDDGGRELGRLPDDGARELEHQISRRRLLERTLEGREGLNDAPDADIAWAFFDANEHYGHDSSQWQEAAHRYMEILPDLKAAADKEFTLAERVENQARKELENYREKKGIDPLDPDAGQTDAHYQQLLDKCYDATYTCGQKLIMQMDYQNRLDGITPYLRNDMHTTFYGMNGANFKDSYDGFNTGEQGKADSKFQGTCGIIESCNIVNQQLGTDLTEADGIKEFVDKGLCEVAEAAGDNGGTTYLQRKAFLESKGLSFVRVEGKELSLDEIARRFEAGESAGLMLKAQDLSQPGLSSRSIWGRRGDCANHATTIAGFSRDGATGKITGIWINDTGGWAGSNRVFIDAEKFKKMQAATWGFAVEFSRKV